jgi:DNA primase
MISEQTINSVKNRVDILDIIGQFIKLKKQGANHLGNCPFHAEKTSSFTVSPARQIYKCFGCGASGDAIKFIQQHEKKSYPEAIEWLASHYHIAIELQEETPEKKQARETAQSQKDLFHQVTQYAITKYHQNLTTHNSQLSTINYLTARGISPETIQFWQIGHAPDDWQFLTQDIINKNYYEPAKTLGLVSEKNGKVYDFFRNRITIPIHDHNGNAIGLGCRWLPTGNKEIDDQQAKYINSKESLIYQKSKVLFGLYQAIQSKAFRHPVIHNADLYCYLVEGYFDVITLHNYGFQNTVAPCGTALTEDHIKLLKRYINHMVLIRDTDAAGKKAMQRDIDLLLAADFHVSVVDLPTAKDIDEYARNYAKDFEPG